MVIWYDFLERAYCVDGFTSLTGTRYAVERVFDNTMSIVRLDANRDYLWDMDLEKVYEAYVELEDFSTTNFKHYLPRRHSPARGLLLHLGLLEVVD